MLTTKATKVTKFTKVKKVHHGYGVLRGLRGLAVLLLSIGVAADAAAQSDVADAMMRGDSASVRALLQKKSNVNASQVDGTTALHWAAHWDDLETARLLLRDGANAKAVNRYVVTQLHEDCPVGNDAKVEALMKA